MGLVVDRFLLTGGFCCCYSGGSSAYACCGPIEEVLDNDDEAPALLLWTLDACMRDCVNAKNNELWTREEDIKPFSR